MYIGAFTGLSVLIYAAIGTGLLVAGVVRKAYKSRNEE